MTLNKIKIALLTFLFVLSGMLSAESNPTSVSAREEIDGLKVKIEKLTNIHSQTINNTELKNNNKLAKYQAQLLIKVISYEIYINLRKNGVSRKLSDIEDQVRYAYLCTWIFTDLGVNSSDRLVTILQWDKDESNFKKDLISHWKAGTYLPALDKKVLKDTIDYGALQINEAHLKDLRSLSFLYESGVINFKIKRIRKMTDVLDVPTNIVARCVIETDRKARGWEWRHVQDKEFNKFLKKTILKLESEGLYSTVFAEKYYNAIPVRTYTKEKFF